MEDKKGLVFINEKEIWCKIKDYGKEFTFNFKIKFKKPIRYMGRPNMGVFNGGFSINIGNYCIYDPHRIRRRSWYGLRTRGKMGKSAYMRVTPATNRCFSYKQ